MRKIMGIGILILSLHSVWGQTNPTKLIVGCWKFQKMEFEDPKNIPSGIEAETKNTKVCFEADGSFVTRKGNNPEQPIHGQYSISPDGKKITQETLNIPDDMEIDAEIVKLDEKELVFKTLFGLLYFQKQP